MTFAGKGQFQCVKVNAIYYKNISLSSHYITVCSRTFLDEKNAQNAMSNAECTLVEVFV